MPAGRPIAMVVPHAGWIYSGVAAGAAFRLLSPGDFSRVVLIGPSHYGGFDGYGLDDSVAYQTPLGDIPVDREAVRSLLGSGQAGWARGAARPEHCLEIELPFLQATLGQFQLVPVLAGRTSRESERAFAAQLAHLADGKTLFVFSTDFIHYGRRFDYAPFGPLTATARQKIRETDDRAVALLSRLDASGFRAFLDETKATICGRHGLSTLLELLPLIAGSSHATVLSHYASSDLQDQDDDGSSVDYVSMVFTKEGGPSSPPLTRPPAESAVPTEAPPISAELGARLARLARATLEDELTKTSRLAREMAELPAGPEASRLQAVFVTLLRTDPDEIRSEGSLRGCIGQVEPTYPLEMAVVRAALSAALDDPRFTPVSAKELPKLALDVTVLSPPRPIASWSEIQIGLHGIVLEKRGRRALFLPQVAVEQNWTLEETLEALSHKAGLPSGAWRDGAQYSVFLGQVFHEKSGKGV
jgi:AmmeMemoRadiSam system protein B/AmmeMemoRadiSam system protein A